MILVCIGSRRHARSTEQALLILLTKLLLYMHTATVVQIVLDGKGLRGRLGSLTLCQFALASFAIPVDLLVTTKLFLHYPVTTLCLH